MTLFFNNDGSILITTPIILILLKKLGLKNHEKIPYLLSGALIATASSAPIGVSNIVNLIALKIVNMTLYMHTIMMFIPATLGLLLLVLILFLIFYRQLPRQLPQVEIHFGDPELDAKPLLAPSHHHPPHHHPPRPPKPRPLPHHKPKELPHKLKPSPKKNASQAPFSDLIPIENRHQFMRNVLLFVFCVRISLFVGSYYDIPISVLAVAGSLLLLGWRWLFLKVSPVDIIKKTPWHIFVFAFGMYVIIYGLNNIGLTNYLIQIFQPLVSGSLLKASLLMGTLISFMSIFFNNHPALLVGTLTLTNMQLDPMTLKTAYLASVIGSDVGALILPIGTLASLMWMHILRQHNVKIRWKDYVSVTVIAIPPVLLFTLVFLASWIEWLY